MIILNPSRFKVEPHSKYWYFCIELWDLLLLRFSENAVLFHIEMGVPKNRGKCKSATISLHRGDSLNISSIVWVFQSSQERHQRVAAVYWLADDPLHVDVDLVLNQGWCHPRKIAAFCENCFCRNLKTYKVKHMKVNSFKKEISQGIYLNRHF